MKHNKEKITLALILSIIVLNLISLAVTLIAKISYQESLRIVFGSVYVLFLPGFIISYIFFPKTRKFEEKEDYSSKNSIDIIERVALSFALSISIVPLTIFYFNLLGVKINLLNSFLTIFAIIAVSLFILYRKNKKSKLDFKV